VSDNARYLVHRDGRPFFYLGDTAWELFHRLNREEADLYLQTRARQGFTAIQAVVLAELDGPDVPNSYGDLPLVDHDPRRPVEAYFQHVDWIVGRAAELGLWTAMLPTWGSHMLSGVLADPAVAHDYGLFLVKRYEDHPINWDPTNSWFDALDAREAAYWALFAGAHGHTYGCQDIWQFWQPGREPMGHARTPWQEALELEAAWGMQHVRRLIESRPFLSRIPDQSLIAEGQADAFDHVQATRDAEGTYAFVYVPTGAPVGVDTSSLKGKLTAWWFDPREGTATPAGEAEAGIGASFTPPSSGRGNDWVLVFDSSEAGYGAPGGPG
jgi:hypothetical protein